MIILSPAKRRMIILTLATLLAAFMGGCFGGGGSGDSDSNTGGGTSPVSGDVVVLAWNDLGMHCLNPTYDEAVILPPYNTVWAQVIERGNPPRIITSGITVEYSLINNTYSYGKRQYGQFWDYSQYLFGVTLAHDTGLNLVDSNRHNGLSGEMVLDLDHFEVDGIPATPVDDTLNWNPYQTANIVVRGGNGAILASTHAMVPTSDEINCARCHGVNAFADVLATHDSEFSTNLVGQAPVLCASCHGSPVLGGAPGDRGTAGTYLSEAIHGSHATRGATCYDCHPGTITQCSRSLRHQIGANPCETCHGTMAQMAAQITANQKVPWMDEPKCVTCHNVREVDTGTALYRSSTGHGGVYCTACHQSPHAMVPSREAGDNYQAIQYMNAAVSMGSCGACHGNSKGPDGTDAAIIPGDFSETHGGTSPEHRTACHVCHTVVPTNNVNAWPHGFAWHSR